MKIDFDNDLITSVFNALPSRIFVVDSDVRIKAYNAAAAELLAIQGPDLFNRRGGEALQCLHAGDVPEGCGHGPFCRTCGIRNSVNLAFSGTNVIRRRARVEIVRDGKTIEIFAYISASLIRFKEQSLALVVIEDISDLATLHSMIPICSKCHRIKDEKAAWHRVEAFFNERWNVDFSHSLCPECYTEEVKKLDE